MASPFLKIGITLAIFRLLGNIPDTKDSLMRRVRSLEMGVSRIFRSLMGILFGPLDLPSFNDCIREDISFDVQGEIKKESKLGLDLEIVSKLTNLS